MKDRTRKTAGRAGAPVPLARLGPPPGAPPALRRVAIAAQIRDLLGDELGRELVAAVESDESVALLFRDASWAAAARSQSGRLAARAAGLLAGRRLAIRSADPHDEGGAARRRRPPAPPAPSPDRDGSARERLARAAAHLGERSRRSDRGSE